MEKCATVFKVTFFICEYDQQRIFVQLKDIPK